MKSRKLPRRGKGETPNPIAKPSPSGLADYGNFQAPATMPERTGSAPWAGFISGKEKPDKMVELSKAIGTDIGHPYVRFEEDYYSLKHAAYTVTDVLPYWAATDGDHAIIWISLQQQPFNKKIDGQRVKECYLTLTLVLPGTEPLPEPLRPALMTVSDFRGTKCGVAADQVQAIKDSMTDEWAQKHGSVVSSAPPAFRVASSFVIKPKPGTYPYAIVDGRPEVISLAQVEALHAWWEECTEERESCEQVYKRRCARLERQAAEHAGS